MATWSYASPRYSAPPSVFRAGGVPLRESRRTSSHPNSFPLSSFVFIRGSETSCMTTKAIGYAAQSAQSPLAPWTFPRRDLLHTDVQMEILYCGVCHSDLHTVRNEWQNTTYPAVPGHEIIGRITAVGNAVKNFKVGGTAAVGCLVG